MKVHMVIILETQLQRGDRNGANRTGLMRRTWPTRRTGPTRCKLRWMKELGKHF